MPQTIVEKILTTHTTEKNCSAGDYITADIDLAFSHDNTALVIDRFTQLNGKDIWNPQKTVIALDHRTPANTIASANQHQTIRQFVHKNQLPHFFDVGKGVGHQLLQDHHYIKPGMLMVGSDSHSTMHGAIGAFATGVGATDLAVAWKQGTLWFRIPKTIKITITGTFQPYVTTKDLSLHIIKTIGSAGATYKSIEFYGPTIQQTSIASRLSLCNMMMEAGAKNAVIPNDQTTHNYLKEHHPLITADKDATYDQTMTIDVSNLIPQIACPHTVDNVKTINQLKDIPIDQIVIGSCTNGRLEDFQIASHIIRKNPIANTIRLLLIPASHKILQEGLAQNIFQPLITAGATLLPPGCGPCLGLHQGVIADHETVLSTTNRNFQGRMGSPHASIYLCSPAVAAASALTGTITNPQELHT